MGERDDQDDGEEAALCAQPAPEGSWEGLGGAARKKGRVKGKKEQTRRESEKRKKASWSHAALWGPRSQSWGSLAPGGEPRQAGSPAIKESTVGCYEDLLGPAVPLSSEGIKNKLLRAST